MIAASVANESLLTLDDVAVGYPGRAVVEHVSISVARGELLALLGPNGAGKTTLLKTLLGLLPVLGGRISWAPAGIKRVIGYVPQHDRLDPIFPLTALEVVTMGTYAGRGLFFRTTKVDRAVAHECLEQVGLTKAREDRFADLSGGQKQRVLIARALAAKPEILLLDEPTAGVDPGAEASIMRLIRDLNGSTGLTVVLVSHHLALVRTFIESVVWVSNHRAVKGSSAEMLTLERIESIFGEVETINE